MTDDRAILPPEAKDLSTAEVSDALDALRLPGSVLGSATLLAGSGYWARPSPCSTCRSTRKRPAPSVTISTTHRPAPWSFSTMAGRTDCTVWGGILSRLAARREIAGTVINGVCRDTAEADDVGYALFGRGRFMRTGKDRVEVKAVNVPVSLGDVRVEPGDIIVADQDGVVVVPARRAAEVFQRALALHVAELRIVDAALSGKTLAEARRQASYHTLQLADG